MPENQSVEARRRRRIGDLVGIVLLVLFSPLFLVLILLIYPYWLARRAALRIAMLVVWGARRRRVLFVYSDSPVWGEYIRERILPRLPPNAVILNWSERSRWRRASLAAWAFRDYAGISEFNPFGLVVPPLGRARLYRFWQPFRDFKHGKPQALRALETRFFDDLESV
jgi:hypothetical protein